MHFYFTHKNLTANNNLQALSVFTLMLKNQASSLQKRKLTKTDSKAGFISISFLN